MEHCILFFIVKYANLSGFCCRRPRDNLSSLLHALFIPVLIGLCSYKNVLAIWGHSRWKLTLTQIIPLRAFSFVLTAILNSQEASRCTLVPRLPFPVPRSPFPVLVTSVEKYIQTKVSYSYCCILSEKRRNLTRWMIRME